jgi:MraZ protein
MPTTEGHPRPSRNEAGRGCEGVEASIVFVGEYDRSVDGTGRLALPSTFRDDLGERCYVTRHPDGYLRITSLDDFRSNAADVLARVERGELPEAAARTFGVNSFLHAIDKQGRITLDDESRRHAGITVGGNVVVAGALNCLQIWRPSRFRTIRSEDGVQQPARVWLDEEGAS